MSSSENQMWMSGCSLSRTSFCRRTTLRRRMKHASPSLRICAPISNPFSREERSETPPPDERMRITYELIKSVTAQLYERALKKIPEDTKEALRRAKELETNPVAKQTLQ